MAYALVAHVAARSTTANTITTASIDTSGADFLVLQLADNAGSTISDSKGNTWTKLTTYADGQKSTLYYVWNAATGTGHTFTATGTNTFPSVCVAAFSGSQTSSDPFDAQSGGTHPGSTSMQPGSITPAANNELIVAGFSSGNDRNSSIAIDSGFTITDHNGSESFGSTMSALAYLVQTTATAVNPTWSWTSTDFPQNGMATFKAAAGGGGGGLPFFMQGDALTGGLV